MSNSVSRSQFMSTGHRTAMAGVKRTHQNCIEATGVARPGKTKKDAWNRANKAS